MSFFIEGRLALEKYGVDEKKELKKEATEAGGKKGRKNPRCPDCGEYVIDHGSVLLCPRCGSQPFE